jgi:DNA-binding transcriptional ArsR family regulator
MLVARSSPFGSPTRTGALVALRLLNESYPRELARILEQPLFTVQRALAGLESDGLVAAVTTGRTRLYRINPRYFALKELWDYLGRLAEPEESLRAKVESLRRRPRRTGKRL